MLCTVYCRGPTITFFFLVLAESTSLYCCWSLEAKKAKQKFAIATYISFLLLLPPKMLQHCQLVMEKDRLTGYDRIGLILIDDCDL